MVKEKSPQSGHRNQFNKSAGSRPREIPSAEKSEEKLKTEKIGQTVSDKKNSKSNEGHKIRIIALCILTVLAGLLAWYSLYRILDNGLNFESGKTLSSIITLIFPVLSFCLWIAFIGLTAIFINKKLFRYLTYFFSLVGSFLFFGFSFYTLLILIIFALAFSYFSFGIRKERNDRIKFHVLSCIKVHLMITLFICVLGVSIIFYAKLMENENGAEINTSSALSTSLGNIVNLILVSQFEGYSSDMTLDEFMLLLGEEIVSQYGGQVLEEAQVEQSFQQENLVNQIEQAIASGQISRDQIPPDVLEKIDQGVLEAEDIVEAELAQVFTASLAEGRDDFLAQLGVEAEGNEKMSEVVKKVIEAQAETTFSSWDHLVPPVLAITLFLSLAIFNFLYVILTKIFALLIYMIMLLTGFIKVKKESKEVEIAKIS